MKANNSKSGAKKQTIGERAQKIDLKNITMTKDKKANFLLKDKQQRPPNTKAKTASDLKTNQVQDESINLTKILNFYRNSVEAHEKDRFAYLQKMETLRIKQDKAHQTEWELRKRTQEMQELSTAVEQCQSHLGLERGTIMEMKFGGDNLKLK